MYRTIKTRVLKMNQEPPVERFERPSAPMCSQPEVLKKNQEPMSFETPRPYSNPSYPPCPSNNTYQPPCNPYLPPCDLAYPPTNSPCPFNPGVPSSQSPNTGWPKSSMCPKVPPSYPSYFGGNISGGPCSGSKVSSVSQQRTSPIKLSPTIQLCSQFCPRKDAEALRKATKGCRTDKRTLIEILARRVNSQRQEIALQFKTLFGRYLLKDIRSETSGNLRNLLGTLLTPLPQYYATELHNAMARMCTKRNVLIEILCTASNHEIRLINDAYRAMYCKRLEDDISSHTSSHLKRLLVALSLGNRDESSHVDRSAAEADAAQLLRATQMWCGNDESVFHQIFVITNRCQLQVICNKYQDLTGHSIEKAIEKEFSGDIKTAFLAIAKSTNDRAGFFAEELYKSMKGCSRDNESLIRLIVTRCETDLGEIKKKFQCKYSKSLEDRVTSECSGDYKKCLLALID